MIVRSHDNELCSILFTTVLEWLFNLVPLYLPKAKKRSSSMAFTMSLPALTIFLTIPFRAEPRRKWFAKNTLNVHCESVGSLMLYWRSMLVVSIYCYPFLRGYCCWFQWNYWAYWARSGMWFRLVELHELWQYSLL